MTDNNETKKAKLNGCGWTAVAFLIAFAAAALYILFMFGAWIGAQV